MKLQHYYRELTFKGLSGMREAFREIEFDRAVSQREAFAARRADRARTLNRREHRQVKHGR